MVLAVVGEIDQFTYPLLQSCLGAALFGAVDEPTIGVVVDLAGVTFCNVAGFALLAQTAAVAAGDLTGYALSGCSPHLERCWQILDAIYPWPDSTGVTRHISVASALIGDLR